MPLLPLLGEEALCPGQKVWDGCGRALGALWVPQLYPAQATVSLGSHGCLPQRHCGFRIVFDRILLSPVLGLDMRA